MKADPQTPATEVPSANQWWPAFVEQPARPRRGASGRSPRTLLELRLTLAGEALDEVERLRRAAQDLAQEIGRAPEHGGRNGAASACP